MSDEVEKIGKYVILKYLGENQFGKIILASWEDEPATKFVIKQTKKNLIIKNSKVKTLFMN